MFLVYAFKMKIIFRSFSLDIDSKLLTAYSFVSTLKTIDGIGVRMVLIHNDA